MAEEKILLVDDAPDVRSILAQLLEQRYEVVTASSAEEALELCASVGPFAVAMSDYDMPGMDGIEFLERMHRSWPETVRVVLTGVGDRAVAVKATNEGQVFRFLSKPCSFDCIQEAIDDAVEHHRDIVERITTTEELVFAKDNLKSLARDLEGRIAVQMGTLQVLHQFAVKLNTALSLEEIAGMAAEATFEALQGHGVHVQLWDDDAQRGSIEAYAGPEMSDEMHREPLCTCEGQVGEIVVDIAGPEGRRLDVHNREVLTMISSPTAVAAHNEIRRRERDQAQQGTILALARLSEKRDNETGKHIERVSLFCKLTAEGLAQDGHYLEEVDADFIDDLVRSAPLHDIGKVGIPDSILLKPGRLSPEEWVIMKTHAEIGAQTLEEVLEKSRNPGFLRMGRDIAWCHHERWDGAGYPRGLQATEIPLCARILAIADIYDALTTERPYKSAWSHQRAIDWLASLSGNHLDPCVVASFLDRADQADSIRALLADHPEMRVEAGLPVANFPV